MCTVTSHLGGGRLLLTMNRDEYRSRDPEVPPAVHDGLGDGPTWAAPLDSQSGGTWIGANAAGVVACILNIYTDHEDVPPAPAGRPSRGDIIPRLLSAGSADDVREWLLTEFAPADYAPFQVLIADGSGRTTHTWSGDGSVDSIGLPDGWQLMSSSSWNADEVLPWRRDRFEEWVADGAMIARELPTYHLLQPEGLADRAPLMSRERTSTRSITQIALDGVGGKTIVRYWPDPTVDTLGQPPHTALRLAHTV